MEAWGKEHGASNKVCAYSSLSKYQINNDTEPPRINKLLFTLIDCHIVTNVCHHYIGCLLKRNFFHQVRMLADPKAEFTDAVDLSVDLKPLGGKRSKRYSMIVEDGVVKELNVEPDNTGLSCSLADRIKV